MLVALSLLKRSAKISSLSPIFCDFKIKCSQYIKEFTFLHITEHTRRALRNIFPVLAPFHVDFPFNGKNLFNSRFVDRKIPFPCHMEFGRKRVSSLRKIIWRKRKKSLKNSNQIISGALINTELSFPSHEDSDNMIKSYRDVVANANVLGSKGKNLKKIITDIRQDVHTPYGKWIKDGWLDERAKSGIFIKVVSYNILAQSLLECHPELYVNCNKDYLAWNYRSFALVNQLNKFDADILCLQEVEAQKLDFFNTQLGEFGYRGVFKKRTNGKDDGCAIYYKSDKFDVRECVSVEYYQPTISVLNRDNIGIVLRLSPKGYENQCIVVATTHLLFNPRRHDIKLAQMQILLAEIDRVAFKSSNDGKESSYYPIILTGDFNLKPYTLVYNLLFDGVVDYISHCYQPSNYQFRSPDRPLIPVMLGITDSCQHYHVTKNRHPFRTEISDFQYVMLFNSDRRSLKMADDNFSWKNNSSFENDRFGSNLLHHNLNLASVYSHADICARDATTYQDTWCTVDYIFYGPMRKFNDAHGRKVDGELKLVSYLRLPDCDQATCLGRLPNEVCPSDHLPLSATFHLPIDVKNQSGMCNL